MAECDNYIRRKIPLNIILIGKTGNGRSSTGNSILKRKQFESSSKATTQTLNVNSAYAETNSYLITVVDCPGLENSEEVAEKDNIKTACEKMTEAFHGCKDGVHVFVLVLKFGEKFTREDQKTITMLKDIFGENYFKERGIIILTCGDRFRNKMEEDNTPTWSFMEWCRAQQGNIQTVFMECDYRIKLFNNATPNEEQRNELFTEVNGIGTKEGRYIDAHFMKNAPLREKLIKKKLTMLNESVQRKTDLLTVELGRLTVTSSVQDVENVEKQAIDLCQEITTQGVDESVQEKMRILESLAKNLQELKQGKIKKNVIERLQMQTKELEECRGNQKIILQKEISWGYTVIGFIVGIAIGRFHRHINAWLKGALAWCLRL